LPEKESIEFLTPDYFVGELTASARDI